MKKHLILVLNPGSTSTKIAVYDNCTPLFVKKITHAAEQLCSFPRINDQFQYRYDTIFRTLEEMGIAPEDLDCIVSRGGITKPLESGTYRINDTLCRELKDSQDEHASNLGALIADKLARLHGIPAFIVDPITVDELSPLARITGMNGIERRSIFHALNQKAVAQKAAALLSKAYCDCNLIVAHLGGGVSVGAHEGGRVVDVNNALDGEGPFSPERTGSLPVGSVVALCYGDLSRFDVMKRIVGQGGLVSYFGSNDVTAVQEKAARGGAREELVLKAMAYQVAKEIAACAAVLSGRVDMIVLTGGIAYSELITGWIKERVGFIAPVCVFPGEDEMEALAQGAARVLTGQECCKEYV